MHHGEFEDPRLVPVYDALCGWGPDDEFFLGAVGAPPRRVLDLGCGTGRLTLELSAAGHAVTGVDPAVASLDVARAKPGAAGVHWIHGTAHDAPTAAFDAAVMTSHVTQFLVTDEEFASTLAELARALVPEATLAFDSRDPADRAWERWTPDATRRHVTLVDGTHVEQWTDVTAVAEGRVDFTHHYRFDADPERHAAATIRFRTEPEIRAALATAGFTIEHVFGGWHREPTGAGVGEFVVVAVKT